VQQNLGIFDGWDKTVPRPRHHPVVWYGIKAAWLQVKQRGGFHFANFVTLILMDQFGFAMVNSMMRRSPALAATSTTWITDEAAASQNQIGQANAHVSRMIPATSWHLEARESAADCDLPLALLCLAAVPRLRLGSDVVAFGVLQPQCAFFLTGLSFRSYCSPTGLALLGLAQGIHSLSFYQVVAAGVLYIVSQSPSDYPRQITGLISPTDLIEYHPCWCHVLGRYLRDCQKSRSHEHIFSGTSAVGRQPL